MKKGVKVTLTLIFLMTILFPMISAQPPFQQAEFDTGLEIRINEVAEIEVNTSFTVHAHVYNSSTGILVNDSFTNCSVHFYSTNGGHKLIANMTYDASDGEFELFMSKGNFSTLGEHPWIVQCQLVTALEQRGGFEEGMFLISPSGASPTISTTLMYFLLSIGVFILFLGVLALQIIMPFKDGLNAKGETVLIPRWKYVKVMMTLVTYPLLVYFLNLLISLSKFVNLRIFSNLVEFSFSALMSLSVPVFILTIITTLYLVAKDWKIQDEINKFGSGVRK